MYTASETPPYITTAKRISCVDSQSGPASESWPAAGGGTASGIAIASHLRGKNGRAASPLRMGKPRLERASCPVLRRTLKILHRAGRGRACPGQPRERRQLDPRLRQEGRQAGVAEGLRLPLPAVIPVVGEGAVGVPQAGVADQLGGAAHLEEGADQALEGEPPGVEHADRRIGGRDVGDP